MICMAPLLRVLLTKNQVPSHTEDLLQQLNLSKVSLFNTLTTDFQSGISTRINFAPTHHDLTIHRLLGSIPPMRPD